MRMEMRDGNGSWGQMEENCEHLGKVTLYNVEFQSHKEFPRRGKVSLVTASTENSVMETEDSLGSQSMCVWALASPLSGCKHCLLWN